ncbi:MAG: hypothetical protein CMP22_01785 [Rickettsiales bacterium]|nr:hypothetical protein [Rickettsiales bacterium]|tara:strand:- start:5 stop:784 length:780 start_codon:yes stop_codon:yes gene_type:complete
MEILQTETAKFEDIKKLVDEILTHKGDKGDEIELSGDDLLDWICTSQEKSPPSLHHPRICLFAKAKDVEEDLKSVTEGTSPLNDFSKHIDADLRVFELSDKSSGEFDEKDIVMAITYGMMSISDGVDALVLYGLEDKQEDVFISDSDADIVSALKDIQARSNDRLCALIGAILACRLSKTPVFLNGILALSAASLLNKIDPYLTEHCIYAGVMKCDQKALMKDTNIFVLENESEEMIAQTALSLIAYWQSVLYEDRKAI